MSRQKSRASKPRRGLRVQKDRIICCQYEMTDPNTDEMIDQTSDDDDGFVFLFGHDNADPAFEKLVEGAFVGDIREGVIKFLDPDPEADWEEDRAKYPAEGKPGAPIQGGIIQLEDGDGKPLFVRVVECDPFTLRLTMNDPLAGKTVKCRAKVTRVRAAYADELSMSVPAAYLQSLD